MAKKVAAASLEERTPSAMASADAVAPAELLGAKKGAKLASRDELSQVCCGPASHYACLGSLCMFGLRRSARRFGGRRSGFIRGARPSGASSRSSNIHNEMWIRVQTYIMRCGS